MKVIQIKNCDTCNKEIIRRPGVYSNIQWEKLKFCSKICFGIKHSKTMSGKKAWNKGIKYNKELCEKMRISQIGKKYPNRTEIHNLKISLSRIGEKNPQWKGGITPKSKLIRSSREYKKWRKSIFERDKYTCVLCNKNGGVLNADHIKRFSEYPELRFDINNGRTLCIDCHIKTDTYGNKKLKVISL